MYTDTNLRQIMYLMQILKNYLCPLWIVTISLILGRTMNHNQYLYFQTMNNVNFIHKY